MNSPFAPAAIRPAIVTIWYVSAPNAHALLATNPEPDVEYATDIAKSLFPDCPCTSLGTFPLTRSATASRDEVYVGSYPGITVVQTGAIPFTTTSALDPHWINPDAAANIYAFVNGVDGTLAGFAHWVDGKLQRAFTATYTEIIEDEGLPAAAEGPYWAGKYPPSEVTQASLNLDDFAIPLPFLPYDMLLTMHTAWLGFSPDASHLNNTVAGFALDDRPEARPVQRDEDYIREMRANAPIHYGGLPPTTADLAQADVEEFFGRIDENDENAADTPKKKRKGWDKKSRSDAAADSAPDNADNEAPKNSLWKRFKIWWAGEDDDDYTPDYDEDATAEVMSDMPYKGR